MKLFEKLFCKHNYIQIHSEFIRTVHCGTSKVFILKCNKCEKQKIEII